MPDVTATIKVGFESTAIFTLVSSSPTGRVQVSNNPAVINLLPSSSAERVFVLTLAPDTNEHVSSVDGATSDPIGQAESGSPTVVSMGGPGPNEVTLTCTYPLEGLNPTQPPLTSTVTFTADDNQEHHDPSIAFNPPE